MAKVLVEVLDAVVDGNKKGAQIEIDANSADSLIRVGYVKRVEKPVVKDAPKAEPKTEPKATKKSKPKQKSTKE